MITPERAAVYDRLRSWLSRANPAVAQMDLDPATDIIASRILESLQVVEFILFIEAEAGKTILVEDLDPNTLRTLSSIYESFFQDRRD